MVIAGIFLSHPSALLGDSSRDEFIDLIGLLISSLGLALRVVARHWKIEHGAGKLVTSGPYSIVRHPLYVGSFLAGLGLCLILGSGWFLAVFVTVYIMLHTRVARSEERFLLTVWPQEYAAYMKSVPGWIPVPGNIRNIIRPCIRCITQQSVLRERTAVCGILAAASLLEAWADYAMEGWAIARVEVIACVLFAILLCLIMVVLQTRVADARAR